MAVEDETVVGPLLWWHLLLIVVGALFLCSSIAGAVFFVRNRSTGAYSTPSFRERSAREMDAIESNREAAAEENLPTVDASKLDSASRVCAKWFVGTFAVFTFGF